jgi:transposase
MQRTPPLPPELWEQISPAGQAALLVIIDASDWRGAALEREVAELKEPRRRNSQNSSRPPSADGPHIKRTPPREPSGRKAGGQPGHPGHRRALVPVEQVSEVVACKPTHCRRWGQRVEGSDAEPLRHQVVEVPPITPQGREYQLHRVRCDRCGITTGGQLPRGVPSHGYGPRLASVVALCGGAYRLSKRKITSFCRDVLGIPLAVGEVCKIEQTVKQALRPAVKQARVYVQSQDTNVDETPWREHGRRRWLWTVVTAQVSVFQIAPARGAPVLQELVGKQYAGVVTSDRAKAYDSHPGHRRQLCWAHLRRDFQAMSDRGGAAKTPGPMLLEQSNLLFT